MVFEYAEGDSILGGRFVAPRSNRFYFVHDPNGGEFKQMEIYHELVKDTNRHMFGGYQLLQKLDFESAIKRFEQQDKLWKDMRKMGDHMIHVEFADFSST